VRWHADEVLDPNDAPLGHEEGRDPERSVERPPP
jgi:hypothetical protein